MFTEIGRLSGKPTKRRLTETEHAHLQTYLLTNCEDVLQYERHATEDELQQLRHNGFSAWLLSYSVGIPSLYTNDIATKYGFILSGQVPRNYLGKYGGHSDELVKFVGMSSVYSELQNKDERIVALEEQNATILSENATILAQL
ncbi:hypothetical protein DY000_02004849 [Brassica cretica]|uniref:Uncharacterized protein n=1 Tax=Brassica cretica TaxID=69181 RepID=A0ABQ7BZI7_BRACR|nr:hypothetical protein DY000_02004849 [Brassica cretica]